MSGLSSMGFGDDGAGKVRKSLLIGLCGLLALCVLSRWDVFSRTIPIRGGEVRPFAGHAYSVRFPARFGPWLEYPRAPLLRESFGGEEYSPLVLLRDGAPAWPGPSSVVQVVFEGGGRYVLTDPYLLFSVPDGESPPGLGDDYRVRVPMRVTWPATVTVGLAVVLLLLGGKRLDGWLRALGSRGGMGRTGANALGVLGLALLSLNLAGLMLPYRNPFRFQEPRFLYGSTDVSLTPGRALALLERRPGESDFSYASRAAGIVHRAVGNCMYNRDMESTGYRVPIWKNFILWACSWYDPRFEPYDFVDPERGLERAVGKCRQHALILRGFLVKQGIRAGLRLLKEHVVVSARTRDGEALTLDPDTGVVLPFGLEEAPDRMDEVRALYERALPSGLSAFRRQQILRLRLLAFEQKNLPPCTGEAWEGQARLESLAYRAKWGLPLLLLVPAVIRLHGRRRQARPPAA
ncbi:MAG: hypothetical protein JRI97_07785 [Deltaproteobacteria bacterium]|nr:hypothetical protein [Deltaproteobacteria bacterium]